MEEEFYIEDDAALLRPPHEQTRKARARGLPLAALLLVASALVFVKNGALRQDDAIELHSEGASLSFAACAQYDDDAFYPADPITGAACFSQDVETSCFMHDLPQYAALASNCAGTCGDDAWSNLCSWQAIRALPATCGGAFSKVAPDPDSRGGRNRGPRSPTGQVDYDDTAPNAVKAGDGCGAHSFCSTCYDDDGNLSPYCDAVTKFYAAAHGMDKVWMTGVYFWRSTDLDFWCADDTQAALAAYAAGGGEPTARLLEIAPAALKAEPYRARWVPGTDPADWLS